MNKMTTIEPMNRAKLHESIINKEDSLFLDVDDEHYQERNREIALSRLENRIVQALVIPKKSLVPKKRCATARNFLVAHSASSPVMISQII